MLDATTIATAGLSRTQLPAQSRPRAELLHLPAEQGAEETSRQICRQGRTRRGGEGRDARNWAALFNRKANQYRNDNPKLPTLGPWVLKTKPRPTVSCSRGTPITSASTPKAAFAYIDKVICAVADEAHSRQGGAGESMLQGLKLRYGTIPSEGRGEDGRASCPALEDRQRLQLRPYPNLSVADPVWHKLIGTCGPPRAFPRDQPARDQPGHLRRACSRGRQYGPLGKRALPAGIPSLCAI